jgi:hypothetical protein
MHLTSWSYLVAIKQGTLFSDSLSYTYSLKSITNTTFKYLCNLAGTEYELPEDNAVALNCRGRAIKISIINCTSIVHLLVRHTINKDASYTR